MGLQVFLNCAGFIKIAHTDTNEKYEVLDGTRIHPETYDWPRKMAIDALEYDEVSCYVIYSYVVFVFLVVVLVIIVVAIVNR